MSLHHQNHSLHFQFQQSPHRQRVCDRPPNPEDSGMFVYANRNASGWYGPEWYAPPTLIPKVWQKVVIVHKRDCYYPDGSGGWIYFTQLRWDITLELHHDVATLFISKLVVGSHSGTLFQSHWDEETCTEILDYQKTDASHTYLYAPDGTPFTDIFPIPGSGSGIPKILAVGDGYAKSELVSTDDGGVFDRIESEVTCSLARTPASVLAEMTGAMAAMQLSRVNRWVSCLDINGDPIEGYFGLGGNNPLGGEGLDPYLGNRAVITWPNGCDGTGDYSPRVEFGNIGAVDYAEDMACVCYTNRHVTWNPANFNWTSDVGTGGASGIAYSVNEESWPYGYAYCGATYNFYNVMGNQVNVGCYAKKSLLVRDRTDAWTVLDQYYPTPGKTCIQPNIAKRYRWYFPTDTDLKGAAAADDFIYVLDVQGCVYRELPYFAYTIPDICPEDCPDGNYPWGTNPCDP